ESGRTGADHNEVVRVAGHRAVCHAELLRELTRGGPAQRGGRGHHNRGVAHAYTEAGEQHVGIVDVLEIDPGVRQAPAVRVRTQCQRLGRVARTDDANRTRARA